MTIEEARALIPPGWVECDEPTWAHASGFNWHIGEMVIGGWDIYAIPAPRPEPRRLPMGWMEVLIDEHGYPHARRFWTGPVLEDFANTKWEADFDAREWVEVRG